jgi:hypothetical protein
VRIPVTKAKETHAIAITQKVSSTNNKQVMGSLFIAAAKNTQTEPSFPIQIIGRADCLVWGFARHAIRGRANERRIPGEFA